MLPCKKVSEMRLVASRMFIIITNFVVDRHHPEKIKKWKEGSKYSIVIIGISD